MRATGHATQVSLDGELAMLVTYRDGKAITSRDFRSHAEAMEAAGLSDSPQGSGSG
jgi:hypothetical protein